MGFNEVVRISDINIVEKFFSFLQKQPFSLGTDVCNGYCSGDVKITRCGENHISMFTKDNNSDYIFNLKSIIVYLPDYESDFSPIFIFESDIDNELDEEMEEYLCDSQNYPDDLKEFNKNKIDIDGLYFEEDKRATYNKKEINEFYMRCEYDEDFIIPPHHSIRRFVTRAILCHINIQGLDYGRFAQIIRNSKDYEGKDFALLLKEAVKH